MPTFDWEAIRTKVLISTGTLILGAICYLVYPIGYGMYQDVADLKVYVGTHETLVNARMEVARSERSKQEKKLEQLLKYHERDYEITGTGSVGTFGGDESYVRVNRRSDARIYKDGDDMWITCDIEGKPKAVFEVRGNFSNADQDLMISFSKEAAEELGITGRVEVEIEPVIKEE